MLKLFSTSKFKKGLKKVNRQRKKTDKLYEVIQLLRMGQKLPIKNEDHKLTGPWQGYRECHLLPDFLLIYRVEGAFLTLAGLGSHSELFKS